MSNNKNEFYNIPIAYRKMENLHIVFWLFKDIAWCLSLKLLGVTMIIPTMAISIIIAWRTRKIVSELCHNLAITVWISANSFWMCTEFFGVDHLSCFWHYYGKTFCHDSFCNWCTNFSLLLFMVQAKTSR